MALRPVVTVETAAMERWLVKTAAATGKAVGELLPQQMGLLAKDLVAGTPPFSGGFDLVNQFSADKRVGQFATARDIRKVFATTAHLFADASAAASGDPDQPPEDAGKAAVKLAKKGDQSGLMALLRRLGADGQYDLVESIASEPDPAVHARSRKARGRVYLKKPRQIVTSAPSLNRYIKKKTGNVGRHKKGWVAPSARFAPKGVPGWILGQLAAARLLDRTRQAGDPSATIANTQAGLVSQNLSLNIVAAALAQRSRKMEAALRAKMRGAWRK